MEKISNPIILNQAGKDGLVLGLVTVAFMFASQLAGGIQSSFLQGIAGFVLWAAKFSICIILMRVSMAKLVQNYDSVINADTFRLGMFIGLFSALIYAAANLVNMLYISPDMISDVFDQVLQQAGPMLNSNSREALAELEPKMPTISFFSNFIYCFIYGIVLSAILSRRIPSPDPFAGYRSNDDTEE